MKGKPIIFSSPMVKAILEGRKTQTRRVINPRYRKDEAGFHVCTNKTRGEKWLEKYDENEMNFDPPRYIGSPYQPGDILWVRETFTSTESGEIIYKADSIFNDCTPGDIAWDWKPSIHMKREAARIFLKVKAVRVERLKDMSEEDAVAEGAVKKPHYMRYGGENCLAIHGRYKKEFAKLWDTLNAKRGYGWDINPWVWIIEFERIDGKE